MKTHSNAAKSSRIGFLFSLTLLMLMTTSSCENKPIEEENPICSYTYNPDALDGILDESEAALLESCFSNAYTTKAEIEANMNGEWLLIGHAASVIKAVTIPCSFIIFAENELFFHFDDGSFEFNVSTTWEITETIEENEKMFKLEVEENFIHDAINNRVFCDQYMYIDFLDENGNMYLYEKIN